MPKTYIGPPVCFVIRAFSHKILILSNVQLIRLDVLSQFHSEYLTMTDGNRIHEDVETLPLNIYPSRGSFTFHATKTYYGKNWTL